MAFIHSPKIVTDGLVLCFDAGNTKSYPGSGTVWNNLTLLTPTSGTLTAGPTFNGNNGGTIVFDGTDDRVLIPNDDNIRIGTSSYSIDAWVKPTALPASSTAGIIYRKNTGNSTEVDMSIFNQGSAYVLRTLLSNTACTTATVYSSSALNVSTNTWYHFCVTRSASNAAFYQNGELIGTLTNVAIDACVSTATAASASIGAVSNGLQPFSGNIAIVRLYKDKRLTADEVLQNYNATRTRFGV